MRCLRGLGSGQAWPSDRLMNLDPNDQRPVQIELDLERLRADYPERRWLQPDRTNMWRYGPLLPLADSPSRFSLGEGWTALLPAGDEPVARRHGFDLRIKDEGFPHPGCGANPTGSFKDRGMAMVVSMARNHGLTRLAVPTQGNAGDSLCRYARAAGIEVAVVMPSDTPLPILGGVAAAAMRDDGAHLDLVTGTIREAGALMKERWLPQGYFNCATFQEPGWRIEGKKTLGLELAEQLDWRLPAAVVYPTGGGTGVLGMWKAFGELRELGVVDGEMPRFYCVQAAATAPLVAAWEAGATDTTPVSAGQTLATGLNVPGGVGHFKVLEIVRHSGGRVLAVDEAAIGAALRDIWQRRHWWICPEGAACLAALETLGAEGDLRPGETVVVVNTGSFEKYLPEVRHLLA